MHLQTGHELLGDVGPGFGHQARGQRQGVTADRLHQDPQPAEPEQPHAAALHRPAHVQERPQIRQRHGSGRRPQFQVAPHTDHPQRCHRQRQPQPRHPRWVRHLRLLPLPAAAFGAFEALLAPAAQAIPLRVAAVGRQVGQNVPGLGMPHAPPRHQRARQLTVAGGKRRAAPTPALPALPTQLAQPGKLGLAGRAELAALIDAQERMPPQAHDAPKQPAGVQPAVGQHQDGPVRRDRRAQVAQHTQPLAAPRPFLASGQDGPGDGDGAAAIDDADGQDHEAVAQAGRVDRERQLRDGPQAHDPGKQRNKTGGDIEGLALGAGFVRSVEAPLVQALLERGHLLVAEQGQKGGDRAATTAASEGDAETPQR